MKNDHRKLERYRMKNTVVAFALLFGVLWLLAGSITANNPNRAMADSVTTEYESENQILLRIDSTSTLNDYLSYAALKSHSLRQAFYHWKAALEKTGYAGALPDPMISYGYFIENVETRVGPQNQKLSLKQSIPWFGTLGARKDIANESANVAFRKYQAEKLKLFYSARAAYYDLYYLGREISLTKGNFELLKFWESVARTKYKVALKKHPDIIKAQVELGKLEDRLLTLQDKIGPTVARLKAVVNLADTFSIVVPAAIEIMEVEVELRTVLNDALQNSPNLNAMIHFIDKEKAGVRLAQKASLPNFTIGVDYIETGEALSPSMEDSGKDTWVVGVGLNLPIWFGKNKAKKNEARAKLRAAEYRYADSQNRLEALVEKIVFQYSDALRKTRLYRDGLIPKAEQALNASYTAYQAAETDFLNVLDAQRQLLAFQLQYERAIADLATRRAEIEMITGNELLNK
ncbi:MAG: TolC family protein [candidate division Zixibacteria bacterium]|nr:TolC family protein [candidate division Zixibacteria bacterium]